MIARAEYGESRRVGRFRKIDDVARDVGELYEAARRGQGPHVQIQANENENRELGKRELVSQAPPN